MERRFQEASESHHAAIRSYKREIHEEMENVDKEMLRLRE